ncbi:BREX protein BrxB domain-containing protein [Nocardia sp. NPDC006630]|uniref:BREX protein BrxB domain-containing protein n=1 Tax=Nocardia sp. NPDC006630 TaxID=3157181 RepID=UPI0033A414EF
MVRNSDGMTFEQRFEHAYRVMSSSRFLEMKGLGNEVPYFILTYQPQDEPKLAAARDRLLRRLRGDGTKVCEIDLWALASRLWRATGIFDQILAAEPSMTKSEFGDNVANVVSPVEYLSPLIAEQVRALDPPPKVTVLSNVGRLFPLVRAHAILNTLQPLVSDVPVVLIFPGSFRQSTTQGSSLELFDKLTDDDYYRAFDLLDQETN